MNVSYLYYIISGLTQSHTVTPFDALGNISLFKTLWEKEILLVMSKFSFTHRVFYPFRELSGIFIKFKIVICRLFQFGPVQNLSSGNGLIKVLSYSERYVSYVMVNLLSHCFFRQG